MLERITFYNEDNGFLIGKVRENDKSTEIAVVGKAPKIQCGETLVLEGNWTTHPKHGKQFSFEKFESKFKKLADQKQEEKTPVNDEQANLEDDFDQRFQEFNRFNQSQQVFGEGLEVQLAEEEKKVMDDQKSQQSSDPFA